jgi:anti-sigma factor RsiW
MKEQLIHILDQSVCLSRKQMKEYLSGTMLPEETHAAEVHLSACPLCSMAMEGFEEHSDEALQAIASLNSGFLKEHFANIAPQIHLNSMAPAATMPSHANRHGKHGHVKPIWTATSIAAAVLVAFGVLWYAEIGRNRQTAGSGVIAMNNAAATRPGEKPVVSDATPAVKETAPTSAASQLKQEKALNAVAAPIAQTPTVADKKTALPLQSVSTKASGGASAPRSGGDNNSYGSAAPVMSVPPPPENNDLAEDKMVAAKISSPAPGAIGYTRNEDAEDRGGRNAGGPALARNRAFSNRPIESADDRPVMDAMDKGDESYDKGKWGSALAHYQQEMNNGNARKRHQATIMAARCYMNMGNKARAIQLLEGLVSEGGPEKRTAKRLLHDLKGE